MAHRLVSVDTATFELPQAVRDALNIPENASDVGARPDNWQPAWADVQEKPSTFPPSTHNHDDRYYTESETDSLLDAKVDVATLISADLDNTAGLGSDGGVYVGASQPPGDYIEPSDLATMLKYAAPLWVLEANEDETDLPADFPTAPFFPGGPPPIVLRKKPEA